MEESTSLEYLAQKPDSQVLSAIKAVASRHPELHTAVLFGSAAAGRVRRDGEPMLRSDVDIAVAADQPLSYEQRLELRDELERAVRQTTDLVDLHEASGLHLREIMSSGIAVVNRKPEFRARKATEMYRDEYTFAPLLRAAKQRRLRESLREQ